MREENRYRYVSAENPFSRAAPRVAASAAPSAGASAALHVGAWAALALVAAGLALGCSAPPPPADAPVPAHFADAQPGFPTFNDFVGDFSDAQFLAGYNPLSGQFTKVTDMVTSVIAKPAKEKLELRPSKDGPRGYLGMFESTQGEVSQRILNEKASFAVAGGDQSSMKMTASYANTVTTEENKYHLILTVASGYDLELVKAGDVALFADNKFDWNKAMVFMAGVGVKNNADLESKVKAERDWMVKLVQDTYEALYRPSGAGFVTTLKRGYAMHIVFTWKNKSVHERLQIKQAFNATLNSGDLGAAAKRKGVDITVSGGNSKAESREFVNYMAEASVSIHNSGHLPDIQFNVLKQKMDNAQKAMREARDKIKKEGGEPADAENDWLDQLVETVQQVQKQVSDARADDAIYLTETLREKLGYAASVPEKHPDLVTIGFKLQSWPDTVRWPAGPQVAGQKAMLKAIIGNLNEVLAKAQEYRLALVRLLQDRETGKAFFVRWLNSGADWQVRFNIQKNIQPTLDKLRGQVMNGLRKIGYKPADLGITFGGDDAAIDPDKSSFVELARSRKLCDDRISTGQFLLDKKHIECLGPTKEFKSAFDAMRDVYIKNRPAQLAVLQDQSAELRHMKWSMASEVCTGLKIEKVNNLPWRLPKSDCNDDELKALGPYLWRNQATKGDKEAGTWTEKKRVYAYQDPEGKFKSFEDTDFFAQERQFVCVPQNGVWVYEAN